MDSMHPVIRKCIKQLKVLEEDKKIRQIVYMYMKGLQNEFEEKSISPSSIMKKCDQHLKLIGTSDETRRLVYYHMMFLQRKYKMIQGTGRMAR